VAKILISIPDDLLRLIDRAAAGRGTSRSRFLQEAATRELGWPSAAELGLALDRGRAALAGIGSFESSDLIQQQRGSLDARDRRR